MPRRTIGLDVIVDQCAPWLAGKGFDRNGAFRRFSGAGDCLIVEFQPARTRETGTIRFYLNVGLVLRRRHEWRSINAGSPSDLPSIEDAQVWSRLRDPSATHHKDDWQAEIASATVDQVSQKVTSVLEPVIATFVEYFDRAALLADVRRGEVNAMMVDRRTTTALLLMEHGKSDELRELLDQMRARNAAQSLFADWIWSVASGRASNRVGE